MASETVNSAASAGEASAAVAHNLDQADKVQNLDGDVHAATEAHGGPAEHGTSPALFGVVNGGALVSLAMLVFLGILLWKKVPALIGKALDGRIAAIRPSLTRPAGFAAKPRR